MSKSIYTCVVLLLAILFTCGLQAVDEVLNVPNSGFEKMDADGFPVQWHSRGKQAPPVIQVKIDNKNAHSGEKCLKISHGAWETSTVVSQPLTFNVGHLYRLSGWVKTDSAVTRPMDRYPTSVAACLTMESFPFTNHSPSVGDDSGWQKIDTLFIASQAKDRVRLHLGFNGPARGNAWFDDIQVEKVEDIGEYIPMDTVKWFGKGFRYDDKGWIFIHIEGKPYERGYQYGSLVANEIVSYMEKLGYETNKDDIANGWQQLRAVTQAFMLNKYEEEFLVEMKGIADGAAKAGAKFENQPVDFVDIVTLNSAIDIDQAWSALYRTPNPLSGQNFMDAEDEMKIPLKQHKCSAFLANGPASKDGKIVFGQIFMWSGYTGVHWNIICDVVPDKGHRLVYETYPGGIHSGADFYINDAGIMMGETTVRQTPFNMDGSPQSNRIRKAAQYAGSIDEAAKILSYKNNGMYTNDWLIGDTKTNEIAIFLLGTNKTKMWRSSTGEFPGGTKGFYWSNNNNKDLEVRKEYIANPDNAPYDVVFYPWNRDLAFNEFFKKYNGKIDAIAGVNLWASSPINRAHACDGKITTSEMAEQLVFLAHFGKVTLREKFPAIDNRLLRDYPGATPHLSLGYSIVSPKFVADKLKALKKQETKDKKSKPKRDLSGVKDFYTFGERSLWFNTVYPSSNKENWFAGGTTDYWRMMKRLPSGLDDAASYLDDRWAYICHRLLYYIDREGAVAPLEAQEVYDRYNHYYIPRYRGTFLLHQLRLYVGNETFSRLMNTIHKRFKEKNITNRQIIAIAGKEAKKTLQSFFMQWLNRKDLPQITPTARVKQLDDGWRVDIDIKQENEPYHFITAIAIDTGKTEKWERIEVTEAEQSFSFKVKEKPNRVIFNAGNDIPVPRKNFYTFANYYDDFHHTIFVYGTSRQIEANHTLALRYRDMLADRYTEILPPVKKDSEITETELANHDIFVLGGAADNGLMGRMAKKLGLNLGKNYFQWQGETYGDHDDGLVVVYPNPYNPKKVVYLVIANSALQLYQMTKTYRSMDAWGIYKNDRIVEKGFHPVKNFRLVL